MATSTEDPMAQGGVATQFLQWYKNHIYSVLSRKDHLSYYQSMGSEFRYAIGKVLGTQDRPTLRLASHHCVLYLNLIKNNLNTCILNLHTHTSMHLTHNHGIFILKQAYLSIHKAKENQTHTRNPNIHLAYENPIIHLKQGSNLTWQQDINILQTLIIHLSMFHHIIKVNHNSNA